MDESALEFSPSTFRCGDQSKLAEIKYYMLQLFVELIRLINVILTYDTVDHQDLNGHCNEKQNGRNS